MLNTWKNVALNGMKERGIMSKFFDYIKSKENEIGKEFFCNIEIAKTGQEDKVIIYYRSFSFNKEEKEKQKKEEGLSYLVLNNPRNIDIFVSYGDLYIPTKQAESYVKEGKRLKKLFTIKEFKEFEKRD